MSGGYFQNIFSKTLCCYKVICITQITHQGRSCHIKNDVTHQFNNLHITISSEALYILLFQSISTHPRGNCSLNWFLNISSSCFPLQIQFTSLWGVFLHIFEIYIHEISLYYYIILHFIFITKASEIVRSKKVSSQRKIMRPLKH